MAIKSDDERHEEIVAATLAAGVVQKLPIDPTSHRISPAQVAINVYREILAELRKP